MKRSSRIGALARQLSRPDEHTIDRLYGLEPVFEPDAGLAMGSEATPFVTVSCPYCGEVYETRIDLTAGSFSYVEDCQICCQPIELGVTVNEAGELLAVSAHRMD